MVIKQKVKIFTLHNELHIGSITLDTMRSSFYSALAQRKILITNHIKNGGKKMENRTGRLFGFFAVLSMMFLMACTPAEKAVSSYAEDRALIEDLQARYMFALDYHDYDTYALTFTEDGILDIVGMKWQGREEIKTAIQPRPAEPAAVAVAEAGDEAAPEGEVQEVAEEVKELYPATGRHNITNIVIKIDGDTAKGRAYWFHYGNNNPERKAQFDSYGHYEDEMVKVNGQWLFSKRIIYNEQMAEWIGPAENPCW